jgi:hypothetical protein
MAPSELAGVIDEYHRTLGIADLLARTRARNTARSLPDHQPAETAPFQDDSRVAIRTRRRRSTRSDHVSNG